MDPVIHADMDRVSLGNGRYRISTWCGQGEYEVAEADLFTRERRETTCKHCADHEDNAMHSAVP